MPGGAPRITVPPGIGRIWIVPRALDVMAGHPAVEGATDAKACTATAIGPSV